MYLLSDRAISCHFKDSMDRVKYFNDQKTYDQTAQNTYMQVFAGHICQSGPFSHNSLFSLATNAQRHF